MSQYRLRSAEVKVSFAFVSMILLAYTSSTAIAADPAKSFDELFGAEARKVQASRVTKDSADFAAKLLETSQKMSDDPGFKEYLLNKTVEFAMKDPSGFTTAVQAAEMLVADFDAKKDIYSDKLLGLYQTQYEKAKPGPEKMAAAEEFANKLIARGDDLLEPPAPASSPASGPASQPDVGPQVNIDAVNAAIKYYKQAQVIVTAAKSDMAGQIAQKIYEANAQIDLKKRYDELVGKYSAKPDDAATVKSLALLCLLELDDPALASKYAAASGDEGLKIYVPLATKPLADVQETLCMEIAGWYKSLAGTATAKSAKINALSRCKSYLVQFIAMHGKSDAEQLKAQKMLDDTNAELVKLDPAGKGGTNSSIVRLNLPQKTGVIWEYEASNEKEATKILLSPDCKKLAVCVRGRYMLFDVETRKVLLKTESWGFGEGFTADSKVFLVASGPLGVYDIKTGKSLTDKPVYRGSMANDLPAFSGDGKYIYGFRSQAKTLDVADVYTGKVVKEIPLGCKGNVEMGAVALSADGKLAIVSGFDRGEVMGKQQFCKVMDLSKETVIQNLPCQQKQGYLSVRFLPDGKRAYGYTTLYGRNSGWSLWDIRNGKVLSESSDQDFLAFTPDCKRSASIEGNTLHVNDVASGKEIIKIPLPPKKGDVETRYYGNNFCFTPDGQYIFCIFHLWDGKDAKGSGVYLIGVGK